MTNICNAPNCSQTPYNNSRFCGKHWYRIKKYGTFDLPPKRLCSIVGCHRRHKARALCELHLSRLERTGDTGTCDPRKRPDGTGTISKQGYHYIYKPEHPNAHKNGQLAVHHLVMSQTLRRPLRKGENVHHKNGNRSDNCPANLELWTKVQPAGQSVVDMVAFCREYLSKYSGDAEKLTKPQSAPLEDGLNDTD
jgi:hypothetical protein